MAEDPKDYLLGGTRKNVSNERMAYSKKNQVSQAEITKKKHIQK